MALTTQMKKAYDNLHPDYKKEINRNQFYTFKKLEMLGKLFDEEERSRKRYKPPPAPKDAEFPRLAFHPESYANKIEARPYANFSGKINAKTKLAHVQTELEFGLIPTLTNDAILGVDSLMKLQLGIQFTRTGWKIWCPEHLELEISQIKGDVPEICGDVEVTEVQKNN